MHPPQASYEGLNGFWKAGRSTIRKKGMLTQVCGNNFLVLKVAPPLVVDIGQLDEFVAKLGEVLQLVHASTTFWSEALGLARRVANI
jgi:ornithine--oxo-acid transaminase